MANLSLISDLVSGKKLDKPIDLDMDQALLLEAVKHLKVIRSSVGTLAFFAFAGLVLGILGLLF